MSLLWHILLLAGPILSGAITECGTYWDPAGGKGASCWVDAKGTDEWAECTAADEAACTANCNSPEDVATKCTKVSKEEGDKEKGKEAGGKGSKKETAGSGGCEAIFKDTDCYVGVADEWKNCPATDEAACTAHCKSPGDVATKCTELEKKVEEKASHEYKHSWNGQEKIRGYNLVEPKAPCSHPTGQVVVVQPDGGSCGSLASLAETVCALVVCPYSSADGWNIFKSDSEDVDFIAALIQHISTAYSAPAKNVIVTGFSAGGSMAYRVGCERSDVVGGVVPWGQTFLEPSAGHIPKGGEIEGMTTTEQVIQMMKDARQTSNKCDPQFKRPHFALVGTSDNYYGENGGAYKGKTLWEFYSTNVLGCTGTPTASTENAATLTSLSPATCFEYPSCSGLSPSLNNYCTVYDYGHDTNGWSNFVMNVFTRLFPAGSKASNDAASLPVDASGSPATSSKASNGTTGGSSASAADHGARVTVLSAAAVTMLLNH